MWTQVRTVVDFRCSVDPTHKDQSAPGAMLEGWRAFNVFSKVQVNPQAQTPTDEGIVPMAMSETFLVCPKCRANPGDRNKLQSFFMNLLDPPQVAPPVDEVAPEPPVAPLVDVAEEVIDEH
jgi:hypothetical protein